MADETDAQSHSVSNTQKMRVRPWFERQLPLVLAGLLFAIAIAFWYSGSFYRPIRGPDGPIVAEGEPGLPIQPSDPTAPRNMAQRPTGRPAATPAPPRPQASSNMPSSVIPEAVPQHSGPGAMPPTAIPELAPPPAVAQTPRTQAPEVAATNRIDLNGRPRVVDAALLIFGDEFACVAGLRGEPQFAGAVNRALFGKTLSCRRQPGGEYFCIFSDDGSDYASAMVAAGLARSASPLLTELEAKARASNVGLWSLSPPPAGRNCIRPGG
jgi:hypothetical protein